METLIARLTSQLRGKIRSTSKFSEKFLCVNLSPRKVSNINKERERERELANRWIDETLKLVHEKRFGKTDNVFENSKERSIIWLRAISV